MRYALILLCVLILSACGKKGPLEPRPSSEITHNRHPSESWDPRLRQTEGIDISTSHGSQLSLG
jgi:predicted small lipoprotein YifL